MSNNTKFFLPIDERIFKIVNNVEQAVMLAMIMRKSELMKRNVFKIAHKDFGETIGLTPYQIRTNTNELEKLGLITVKTKRLGKFNVHNEYTVCWDKINQKLEEIRRNVAFDKFYYPTRPVDAESKDDDEDDGNGGTQSGGTESNTYFKGSANSEDENNLKFLSNEGSKNFRLSDFFKIIGKNLIRPSEIFSQIINIGHRLLLNNNNNKKAEKILENQKNPISTNIEDLRPLVESIVSEVLTKVSVTSSTEVSVTSLPQKRKRGRPRKSLAVGAEPSSAQSASLTKPVEQVLGFRPRIGLGTIEVEDLYDRVLDCWDSRFEPNAYMRIENLRRYLEKNNSLTREMQAIILKALMHYPYFPLMTVKEFYEEWYAPMVQFMANGIPYQLYESFLLTQMKEQSRFSVMTPKGSWYYMRDVVASFRNRGINAESPYQPVEKVKDNPFEVLDREVALVLQSRRMGDAHTQPRELGLELSEN